ncbi:MAG: hypothetical protein VKJ24_12320 [Synechococcales bacterium]|nr:hypothetical protein [Synechococcales bacterium]
MSQPQTISCDPPVATASTDCDRPILVPLPGASTDEAILCNHCLRTATNGIKCKGICIADSDY